METGTVKWFNKERGFGFIIQDSGEEDMFVHAGQVEGMHLEAGQKVAYKIKTLQQPDGSSKLTATEVKVKSRPGAAPAPYPYPYPPPAPPAVYPGYSPYGPPAGYAPPPFPPAPALPGQLQTGSVKWFNVAKGFGFIIPSIGGDELYVSSKCVKSPPSGHLNENDLVEFALGTSPEGKVWATNVIVRGLGVPNGVGQKRKAEHDVGLGLKHARPDYGYAPPPAFAPPPESYYAAPAVPAYAAAPTPAYGAPWV